MEPIELRIGNYVNFKSREDIDYCIVNEVTNGGGCYLHRYFKDGLVDSQPEVIDDLTPIKINEIILFRLGFQKLDLLRGLASSFEMNLRSSIHSNAKIAISLCNDKGLGEFYVFIKDSENNIVTLMRDLLYVHQLQNLFFAITKSELKYI